MPSKVTEVPAASPAEVIAHFSKRLSLETDCSDVNAAMSSGQQDFVLIDVRSPQLYAAGHVPGAINMLVGKMTQTRLSAWAPDAQFVVYCAGPHCNGADKGALRLAELGRKVKIMIGGITGWADEGLAFETGNGSGEVTA
jgi:rhodanese-related sulfurtransferase